MLSLNSSRSLKIFVLTSNWTGVPNEVAGGCTLCAVTLNQHMSTWNFHACKSYLTCQKLRERSKTYLIANPTHQTTNRHRRAARSEVVLLMFAISLAIKAVPQECEKPHYLAGCWCRKTLAPRSTETDSRRRLLRLKRWSFLRSSAPSPSLALSQPVFEAWSSWEREVLPPLPRDAHLPLSVNSVGSLWSQMTCGPEKHKDTKIHSVFQSWTSYSNKQKAGVRPCLRWGLILTSLK